MDCTDTDRCANFKNASKCCVNYSADGCYQPKGKTHQGQPVCNEGGGEAKEYGFSRDYEALFVAISAGIVIAAFVDYQLRGADDIPTTKDICKIKRRGPYDISIGVRGMQYGGLFGFEEKYGAEFDLFAGQCESMNLEWIKPEEGEIPLAASPVRVPFSEAPVSCGPCGFTAKIEMFAILKGRDIKGQRVCPGCGRHNSII